MDNFSGILCVFSANYLSLLKYIFAILTKQFVNCKVFHTISSDYSGDYLNQIM
jgi:hypothetical protein